MEVNKISAPRPGKWSFREGLLTFIPGNAVYRSMRSRRARIGVLFIMPFIIGFLLFMVRPLFQSLSMSMSNIQLKSGKGYTQVFTGFANYRYALGVDPYFNQYLVQEIGRMAINVLATLALSFVVAVLLNQDFKGRILARVIFFMPVILSSGVLPGIESQNEFYNMMQGISQEVANASGINLSAALQDLLRVSGVGGGLLGILFQMIDSIYDIVMASGIQIIVFLTGFAAISPSLYEAADVEGCTGWEAFWKITFPMVSPLLLVNCIYTIIDFFMKNDNRVMERINEVMYSQFRFGESAAMSWIYFGVALLFIGISTLIISKGVHYYEE